MWVKSGSFNLYRYESYLERCWWEIDGCFGIVDNMKGECAGLSRHADVYCLVEEFLSRMWR
jgi:hypothetical protein